MIVGGKGSGDRYRIKDDVVTMVHRHIHGTVVTIFTLETTDTGTGYLSRRYSSAYSDPATGDARGGTSHFTDTFVPLAGTGPWVLSERVIATDAGNGEAGSGEEESGEAAGAGEQRFRFEDLQPL